MHDLLWVAILTVFVRCSRRVLILCGPLLLPYEADVPYPVKVGLTAVTPTSREGIARRDPALIGVGHTLF